MSILYIISVLLLFFLFLKVKKSNEKLNLIKWIIITFGLLFCYNSIIAFILNLIKIPINLISLSIVNFIFCIILFFYFKQKKCVQHYYVKKIDIIISIAIIVIIFLIGLFRFGFPFNIVYEGCDPGTHFWTAKEFYNHSYLLDTVAEETVVNFETRQFSSYVNLGILFYVFSPIIEFFDFYQLYIFFDILMLILATLMFYVLVSHEKKKIPIIILFLGIILYMLGYPLNSMMIGFFYLGHSVTIITMLLYLYKLYDSKVINKKISIILLFIINLGLFFTYYFFVPIIFGGLLIHLIYKCISEKRKLFTRENIFYIFICYVLPCIFGFIYFILPNIGSKDLNAVNQITLEGYCFLDLVNSVLLFMPLIIYYFAYSIKKKEFSYELIIFCCLVLFIVLIVFLIFNDRASTYYLSKPYYLLWLLCFMIMFKFIYNFYDEKKLEVNCYLIFILFNVIIAFSSIQVNLKDSIPKYTESNFNDVFGIYKYNIQKYFYPTTILKNDEMDELKVIYNQGVRNVYSNANPEARLWLAAYFETRKINYPENQLYDHIADNYYIFNPDYEINVDNYGILFYRSSLKDRISYLVDGKSTNEQFEFYQEYFEKNELINHNNFALIDIKNGVEKSEK